MSLPQFQETRKRPYHDFAETTSQQEHEYARTAPQTPLDTRGGDTQRYGENDVCIQRHDSLRNWISLPRSLNPYGSVTTAPGCGSRSNDRTFDDSQQDLPALSLIQSGQSGFEGTTAVSSTTSSCLRENADLCEECRSMDLVSAFAREPSNWRYWRDALVGTRIILDDMSSSRCQLCSLLHRVRFGRDKGKYAWSEDRHFEIYAVSYCAAMGQLSPRPDQAKTDTICLFVVPAGSMPANFHILWSNQAVWDRGRGPEVILQCAEQTDAVHGLAVAANYIDFSRVRSWISRYSSRPGGYLHPGTQCRNNEQINARVPSLYLVDCESLQICSWTGQTYVTLSYVWGQRGAEHDEDWQPSMGGGLPEYIPLTIRDAIQVTKTLGFRFLWVDQYCIRQSDNQHKAAQVAAMDTIYGCSALTIIAAAGEDVEFGLPGVSTTSRSNEAFRVHVQGLDLVSSLRRPEELIAESKWASRGWTYQEGLLSSSRLVFTHEQVYFEEYLDEVQGKETTSGCYQVQFESIQTPKNADYRPEKQRYGYFRGGCSAKPVFIDRNAKISVHIKSFAHRQLSYESDTLAAFLGIINASRYKSYWGLPIAFEDTKAAFQTGRFKEETLSRILLDKFACMLCWSHAKVETSRRRKGFPSFSWTGWSGVPLLGESENLSRSELKHRLHFGGTNKTLTQYVPDVRIAFPRLDLELINQDDDPSLVIDSELVTIEVTRSKNRNQWLPPSAPMQARASHTSRFTLYLPRERSATQAMSLECIKIIEARPHKLELTSQRFLNVSADSRLLVIKRFGKHVERVGFVRATDKYAEWIQNLPVTKERMVLK